MIRTNPELHHQFKDLAVKLGLTQAECLGLLYNNYINPPKEETKATPSKHYSMPDGSVVDADGKIIKESVSWTMPAKDKEKDQRQQELIKMLYGR